MTNNRAGRVNLIAAAFCSLAAAAYFFGGNAGLGVVFMALASVNLSLFVINSREDS